MALHLNNQGFHAIGGSIGAHGARRTPQGSLGPPRGPEGAPGGTLGVARCARPARGKHDRENIGGSMVVAYRVRACEAPSELL